MEAILRTILALHLPITTVEAITSTLANEAPTSLCIAKTINHITHTLPQQCLKDSWTRTASLDLPARTDSVTRESHTIELHVPEPITVDTETLRRQQDKSILSFEEWKELMLRQNGQDPKDLQERQRLEAFPRATEPADTGFGGALGEEGEISLNFDVPSFPNQEPAGASAAAVDESKSLLYDDARAQYSRSKDAGKTCKERFSYSSFDAGATVLKASAGTKNPKAILVENKDSYMLFECTAGEKYVIVELSDDILVDTVVLANFEFFSSMIRHFRVSVSDRYPVKAEKWKQLGIFEGKNARDIQPFLVENPQIWARYIRVDFLTYYGNEYYCPVSLLRIHGTRMLESWKETEGPAEDDDSELDSASTGYLQTTAHAATLDILDCQLDTSGLPDAYFIFGISQATCSAPTVANTETARPDSFRHGGAGSVGGHGSEDVGHFSWTDDSVVSLAGPHLQPGTDATSSIPITSISTPSPGDGLKDETDRASNTATNTIQSSSSVSETITQSKPAESTPTQPRNRTMTSNSHQTLPTVQESFFKTVSKRLQLLESNMTWSLKYIEDQSRYIQEALVQIEDGKLFEAEALLANLNHTMHVELGALRQQYEEVWQSMVIALETQREQSQTELVALSSRLNVLADEVVFQKRMSIGQSTLLLCCLVLIIFSRSITHTIPLVSSQPGSGNTFPGSPRHSAGTPDTVTTASAPGDTGNRDSSTLSKNFESDYLSPTSPLSNFSRGRHLSSHGDEGQICEQYDSLEGTPREEAGITRLHPFHAIHRDGAGSEYSTLGSMSGVGNEKKPLPPLPE